MIVIVPARLTRPELLRENRRLRAKVRALEQERALVATVCLLLGSDWTGVPAWWRMVLLRLARVLGE